MAWDSWKPDDRRRPPGEWRGVLAAERVAGLRYRRDSVFAFIHGAKGADSRGLDWGVELEREPDNPHSRHGNAIKVMGRWAVRRLRWWFKDPGVATKRVHIGYVPSDMTDALFDELGPLFPKVPLAAELYEIAVADGAERETSMMGVVIRIIVLLPSKRDPIWKNTGQATPDNKEVSEAPPLTAVAKKTAASPFIWIVAACCIAILPWSYRDAGPSPQITGTANSGGWKTSTISYELVDEKIIDIPIKTQIEQYYTVSAPLHKTLLHGELMELYDHAQARRGFKYHDAATNIYIYVYGTHEQAISKQSGWIGMVQRNLSGQAEISINEYRLALVGTPQKIRHGMNEADRQRIFRDIVAAEDRAMHDADARVPDTQFKKKAALLSQLEPRYKKEVAQKNGLTDKQLSEISVEGIMKGWTMPPLSRK